MFRNYLTTAFRKLWKNRLFSLVNILGLSVGLTVALLIYLYVSAELSYDKHIPDGDQIYRVLRVADLNGDPYLIGVTSAPFATTLKNDFPEAIDDALRIVKNDGLVAYRQNVFREENLHYADPNFFSFFSFPLAVGDPQTVLSNPNNIVISRKIARKYFGTDDPIGETLRVDDQRDFIVSGVMSELPGKMHLNVELVASLALYAHEEWFSNWWSNNLLTYVKIATPEAAAQLETQFPAFIEKYFGNDLRRSGNRIGLTLQPLREAYFTKDVRYDTAAHGDINAVYIFAAIAIFILLIACINYMNLSTARAGRRAREIGVRKVLGASPAKLMLQFLSESFLVTFLAILIALAAVELLLPLFNSAFQLDLALHLGDSGLLISLGILLTLVSLVAGSYPAFLLSSFRPVQVLRGKSRLNARDILLRKGLVVFQFAVSVVLIIATLLVGRQLAFLQNTHFGFDDEQVVLVRLDNRDIREHREQFKSRLENAAGVVSVSIMSGEPGGFHDTMSHEVDGLDSNPRLRTVFADLDYVKTLGMTIVAGRDFSQDYGTDKSSAVLINETAARLLGWSNQEAVGKRIRNTFADTTYRQVVGVVQDFHFASLKNTIEPLIISALPWGRTVAIKIHATETAAALAAIEKEWQNLAPAFPFVFTFLDESFFKLYQQEQKEGHLFSLFTIISIFIACLGIFALATFAAEERTKEIGIRKVLGASVPGIVRLLSGEFLLLVTVASIIAWPLAWYAMSQWLQGFAYRISMDWWVFVLAGGLALLIALSTVVFQAIKAALANPVKSLRYE